MYFNCLLHALTIEYLDVLSVWVPCANDTFIHESSSRFGKNNKLWIIYMWGCNIKWFVTKSTIQLNFRKILFRLFSIIIIIIIVLKAIIFQLQLTVFQNYLYGSTLEYTKCIETNLTSVNLIKGNNDSICELWNSMHLNGNANELQRTVQCST